MDVDAPGLFEMPIEPPSPTERPNRGRNRETWTFTTTATVTILDRTAITDAFARLEETAIVLGDVADPGPRDAELPSRALDQLAWLVWPTEGMGGAIEADAFRILSVETEVLDDADDRGALSWTVTVKLRNVEELRRLAVKAVPNDADLIADSLAVAWQHATDPFAPLCSIPGIDWQPGTVEVIHVPARAARNH